MPLAEARAGTIPLPVDDAHDTRRRDTLVYLVHAETSQLLNHKRRRLVTVQRQFRVHMQMPSPRGQVIGIASDAVDDGHGWTPLPGFDRLHLTAKVRALQWPKTH